jgi:predicted HicB family RNase H-like nuclease
VSEVVFGRVSPALKQALTTRAGERGLSLNATLCELLERALAVSAQEAAGE